MASLSPARAEVEAGVVAKVEQQYLLRLVKFLPYVPIVHELNMLFPTRF